MFVIWDFSDLYVYRYKSSHRLITILKYSVWHLIHLLKSYTYHSPSQYLRQWIDGRFQYVFLLSLLVLIELHFDLFCSTVSLERKLIFSDLVIHFLYVWFSLDLKKIMFGWARCYLQLSLFQSSISNTSAKPLFALVWCRIWKVSILFTWLLGMIQIHFTNTALCEVTLTKVLRWSLATVPAW